MGVLAAVDLAVGALAEELLDLVAVVDGLLGLLLYVVLCVLVWLLIRLLFKHVLELLGFRSSRL